MKKCRKLVVKRANSEEIWGHTMRGVKIENLSLTRGFPGSRAGGRQREKYMDGIGRTVGCRRKAPCILQMTRDGEGVAIRGR